MRLEFPLNDGWKTLARPPADFTSASFDDSHWDRARLPHTNLELPLDNFDPTSFRFVTGYRRTLLFDPGWSGQRVFVVFEAVMARAEVWIDGVLVAEHRGGYTPFEVEVPLAAVAAGSAVLAVLADADENPDIPPFGHAVDYLTFGGMYREAHLEVRPHRYLSTLTLETPAPGLGHLRVRGDIALNLPWNDPIPLIGTLRVFENGVELAGGAVGWAPGSLEAPYDLEVPNARAWDLDSPALYELTVETNEDSLSRTFGFRTAEFRPEGFFLNGTKVKLRGLNRHQSWPVAGYAMPRRAQAADADLVKELGCNIVRSSHYPPSRHFLDRCDQIGLLVFEEIPGWQHLGGEAWKAVALKNVEEMVLRDRHRPSVILWGVRINESADDEFYRLTNARARQLDSRPTGGVRNFAGSDFYEDVYTYNDFVHDGGRKALERRSKIAKAPVPYLVTEHNGHMFPAKSTDPEHRLVEHALRHARVQDAAAGDDEIAGALGWCLADYATHGEFGSGDQLCHHGVVDQFRCPKPAAAFYASQRAAPAFGSVASRLSIGDHDASSLRSLWVFTNSDEVRVFEGEREIGTFRPSKQFKALPHAPVAIDDLIGDALESGEGLSAADAGRVKRFLLAHRATAGRPGLTKTLTLLWVLFKKRWKPARIAELYTKHLAGWGSGPRRYRFEGWTGGVRQWQTTVGPAHAARVELTLDTAELSETQSWDVARAQVRLLNNYGQEVRYGSTPVKLEVSGPLSVQGPLWRPLQGGATAFWLATTGVKGKATLRAVTPFGTSESVEVEIV